MASVYDELLHKNQHLEASGESMTQTIQEQTQVIKDLAQTLKLLAKSVSSSQEQVRAKHFELREKDSELSEMAEDMREMNKELRSLRDRYVTWGYQAAHITAHLLCYPSVRTATPRLRLYLPLARSRSLWHPTKSTR
jgi:chromosome segregation ATPase